MPAADPIWRSALEGHISPGVYGHAPGGRCGVRLRERRGISLMQIAMTAPLKDVSEIFPTLGRCPIPGPGRAERNAALMAMWVGPGRWLLAADPDVSLPPMIGLRPPEAAPDVATTDLSHARTVIRIAGANAVDVLLKGCPLDLESFSANDCAGTLLGHLSVQLHCLEDRCFDVYVFRSFGLAMWRWMRDASMEYGVEVGVD